jgi:hypothetical protein
MRIGKVEISINNEKSFLTLTRNKRYKYIDFILVGIIAILPVGAVIYSIFLNGFQYFENFPAALAALALIVLSTVLLFHNIRRSRAKYRDIEIRLLNNNILINNKPFCTLDNLESIAIERMTDGDGASFYNIGPLCENKFYTLTLDQGKKQAEQTAGIIGDFLGRNTVARDGKMIFP